jgi:hypothetical protein
MSSGRSAWRTRMKELALVGVALVASFLLAELLLRLIGVSYPVFIRTDSIRGTAHIEGAEGWYRSEGESWVEINRDGLRGPDVAVEKPAGTFRVALLGDSYIEAVQVPFDQTVGEVLEGRLSTLRGTPVEVLNFGVGGYGTTQELLTLQQKVWKYAPDLILLAVTTGNDISDNYRPLKRVDYIPYYVLRDGQLALDTSFLRSREYLNRSTRTSRFLLSVVQHSRLAQLLNQVRHSRRAGERERDRAGTGEELGLDDNVYLPPPPNSDWQKAWSITEGVLRLMRDECRSKHVPLAVVTLTTGNQVQPVLEEREKLLRRLGVKDLYYPDRRLAEFGRREGIPVLQLAPPMARQAEERHVFFHGFDGRLGRGHWNRDGHRFAGELLASWIARGFTDPSARDSSR